MPPQGCVPLGQAYGIPLPPSGLCAVKKFEPARLPQTLEPFMALRTTGGIAGFEIQYGEFAALPLQPPFRPYDAIELPG